MKRSITNLLAALLLLVLTPPPSAAQPARTGDVRQEGRFLLVYNIASSMSRRSENVGIATAKLIGSDLMAEIKPGDTLGVWTYNDELHSGQVPLTRWDKRNQSRLAEALGGFLKAQKYEKRARFEPVMENLAALMKISDRLTVLIFTDGEEKISGTPFDKQIAETLKLNTAQQRKERMPFIIILRCEKGTITGHTVNMPPWAPEFPKPTIPIEDFGPDPAVAKKPPVITLPPLIITNPPRAQIVETNAAIADTAIASSDAASETNASPAWSTVTTARAASTNAFGSSSDGTQSAGDWASPAKPSGGGTFTVDKKDLALWQWVAAASLLLGIVGVVFGLVARARAARRVSLITSLMSGKKD